MNEDLFIDWVDFEWSWRALKEGVELVVCCDVLISHQLGDESGVILGKSLSSRAPIRHYYIVRNCLYLALKSKFIGFLDRVGLLFSALKYIIGYPLLFSPRLENLLFVCKGVFDALRGNMGAVE